MGNVIIERVKEVKLTRVQEKIAEYMIQNPEVVGQSSSMDIARAIGVSDASITRFARAIGYEGYTELKNDIYTSMVSQSSGGVNKISLVERNRLNQEEYGENGEGERYLQTLELNLEKSFRENSAEEYQNAKELLINAEHRYILGFRGCLGVAHQFSWLLRFLLPRVIHISDEGTGGVGSMQDIGSKDVVVLFSMSRYYKSDYRLLQIAKKRGAKVCLITNSELSPLRKFADIMLFAETRQSSFFHSSGAMSMIAEYLLTLIARDLPEEYRLLAEERDAMTEELRL